MKKTALLGSLLVVILLAPGMASAHRVGFGFGFFPSPLVFGPPVVVAPPPPVYYYPPPPPPPPAYSYPEEYYPRAYEESYPPTYNEGRVWVPGHWEEQETDRGRERVYVLGHWADR